MADSDSKPSPVAPRTPETDLVFDCINEKNGDAKSSNGVA